MDGQWETNSIEWRGHLGRPLDGWSMIKFSPKMIVWNHNRPISAWWQRTRQFGADTTHGAFFIRTSTVLMLPSLTFHKKNRIFLGIRPLQIFLYSVDFCSMPHEARWWASDLDVNWLDLSKIHLHVSSIVGLFGGKSNVDSSDHSMIL